jgi:biopolymer transport protein ExbD
MPVEDDLRRRIISLMATRNEQVLFFAADDQLTYREVSAILSDLLRDSPALNVVLLIKKQIGVERKFDWTQLSELCLS